MLDLTRKAVSSDKRDRLESTDLFSQVSSKFARVKSDGESSLDSRLTSNDEITKLHCERINTNLHFAFIFDHRCSRERLVRSTDRPKNVTHPD